MNGNATGPINLGNPHEFTIRQLAEQVRSRINPELPLIEKPLPADDPRQRQPDIALAQRELGCAQVSLGQGSNPPSLGFSSCWAEAARLNGRLVPLKREGCESVAEPARHGGFAAGTDPALAGG